MLEGPGTINWRSLVHEQGDRWMPPDRSVHRPAVTKLLMGR